MLLSRVDPRVRWLAPGRVKRQHGVSRLPGHSSRCRMSILWAALTRTCCAMTDLPQGEQEREKGNRVGGKSKSEYPGRKQVRCSKICEGVKITQSTSPSATYRRWHLGASHRHEGRGETFSCGTIFFSGSFYARDFTEKGNVDLVNSKSRTCITQVGPHASRQDSPSHGYSTAPALILPILEYSREDALAKLTGESESPSTTTHNHETPSEQQGAMVEEGDNAITIMAMPPPSHVQLTTAARTH